MDLEVLLNADTLDSVSAKEIGNLKTLSGYSPSLSIHAPFMDLSPGAVDSKVRAATMERFSQVFDVAEVLKPSVIVFHSGYEKWKYDHKIDLWLEGCMKTWPVFIERAASIGTKIAIENIFEEDPDSLKELINALDSPHFGVCFDTGHFNLFSKRPLSVWLESLGPHIMEFHLHDNTGSIDSHLSIGDGNFDFDLLFRSFKNRDVVHTIEAHNPGDVFKSMERLTVLLEKYPA